MGTDKDPVSVASKRNEYENNKPASVSKRVFGNLVTCGVRRGLTKHYEGKITKFF